MDKFVCPVCRTSLTKDAYESALGILEERDSELVRREEELEQREKEFQSEKSALILKAKEARQKGVDEGTNAERKRAERALAEQREDLARQERQLVKRESELKRQKTELIQKAKDALEKGIEQGVQAERKRTERLLSGQESTITKLQEKIQQLEKGSTPQTEGLEFEETLTERLEQEFPSDFAVLVTTGKRKGFSGIDEDDGVLLVAPLGVIPLVRLLRLHLIQLHQARLTEDERARAAEQIVKYLNGPQFKNPLEDMIARARDLQASIQVEVRQHLKTWNERWSSYQSIEWDAAQVQSNIQLVLQGRTPRVFSAPDVRPLPLLSSKE